MVTLASLIKNEETYFISVRFDESDKTRWTKVHGAFTKMLSADYSGYYHKTTSLFIITENNAKTIMDKIIACGAQRSIDHVLVMNTHASDTLFLGSLVDFNKLLTFIPSAIRV